MAIVVNNSDNEYTIVIFGRSSDHESRTYSRPLFPGNSSNFDEKTNFLYIAAGLNPQQIDEICDLRKGKKLREVSNREFESKLQNIVAQK